MSKFSEQVKSYFNLLNEDDMSEPSALPTGAPQGQAAMPPDTSGSNKDASTYGALNLALSFLLFPKEKDIDNIITPEEKQYLFDTQSKGIQSEDDKNKVLDILNKFNLNV